MKSLLKNRARLWMETLEDRAVPAFIGVTGTLPDYKGNLNLTATTNGQVVVAEQTGVAQITLSDSNGGVLVVNNVFGNITLNLKSSFVGGAVEGRLVLDGTTYGDLTGNVNFTLARTSGTQNVDFSLMADSASAILGNFTLTTNAAGGSTAWLNPASDVTIYGTTTLNLRGGTAASNKVVFLGGGGGEVVVGGNFSATLINQLIADTTTINGTATVSTKATTALANVVDFAAATTVGTLSVTMGNVSGTGTSTVNLEGTVNGYTTVRLGTNTGANTTNQVNLGSGANFNGSQIAITGGNGSKQINVGAINAGSAKLLVSLGNAADNEVNFLGGASLLEATLIGGTGTNTVSGVVDFPLRLFRFSF